MIDRRDALRAILLGAAGGLAGFPVARAVAQVTELVLVGVTSRVVNRVEARLPNDRLIERLALHEDMFFDEMIKTAPDAELLIELRDGSTFELGPDAAIRIDQFIFDPEAGTGEKTVEILHGAFRYVSGFTTEDQSTTLGTPHGTLGIRGSVVMGLVDPETPTFVHVAQGEARFTNTAGASDMTDGESIAVTSMTEPPMNPKDMPPSVAAQTLALVARKLPAPKAVAARPATPPVKTKAMAKASLTPVAQQRAAQATRAAPRASAPTRSIAAEARALTQARAAGQLSASPTVSTAPNPEASSQLAQLSARFAALHPMSVRRGTATVVRGLAAATDAPERLARIVAKAAGTNPAVAAVAAHAAVIGAPANRRSEVATQIGEAVARAVPAQTAHVAAAIAAAKLGNRATPALNGAPAKPGAKSTGAAASKSAPTKSAPSKKGK